MNSTDLNQLMATPLSMAIFAIVMVVLTALTMRAVITRERAIMVRERRPDVARMAYVSRWRNGLSA